MADLAIYGTWFDILSVPWRRWPAGRAVVCSRVAASRSLAVLPTIAALSLTRSPFSFVGTGMLILCKEEIGVYPRCPRYGDNSMS